MVGFQFDEMEKKLYRALRAKASPGTLVDVPLTQLVVDAGYSVQGGMHTKSMRVLELAGLVAHVKGKGYIILREM